jgi:hypothetical protein
MQWVLRAEMCLVVDIFALAPAGRRSGMAKAMSRCAMEKGRMGNINVFANTGPCAKTDRAARMRHAIRAAAPRRCLF